MVDLKTITVRLNVEEEKAFREYAKFRNIPLSILFKQLLEEKIEEEADLKAILEYETRLEADETEYVDFDDIKREMGM